MKHYTVTGPAGTREVQAKDEWEARHKAMVMQWGDVSDAIVPRALMSNGKLEPYQGRGLTAIEVKSK